MVHARARTSAFVIIKDVARDLRTKIMMTVSFFYFFCRVYHCLLGNRSCSIQAQELITQCLPGVLCFISQQKANSRILNSLFAKCIPILLPFAFPSLSYLLPPPFSLSLSFICVAACQYHPGQPVFHDTLKVSENFEKHRDKCCF